MALLPKANNLFAEKSYWDDFFRRRGSKAFEWYGDYAQLCGLLLKYVKKKDQLLTVGCGNSTLSVEMYDVGYHNNICIDISTPVVRHMTERYSTDRQNLKFQVADVRKMGFEDSTFTVVLDKGTVDALIHEESGGCHQTSLEMFSEIRRVLKHGGRFICISLLQEHILKYLLNYLTETAWMIRIHRCNSAEESKNSETSLFSFPVFMIVCTKVGELPGFKPLIEFAPHENSPVQRLESKAAIISAVMAAQQYSLFCYKLSSQKLKEESTVDLHSVDSAVPRYKVFIVENSKPSTCSLQYAVFIVPQGQETQWVFSTTEGRQQLCQTAKTGRLLVVHLSPYHVYKNLDEVKTEISQRANDFAPSNLKDTLTPIMSVGDSIGKRTVIFDGSSESTGMYTVEDVYINEEIFRRLIFQNNPNIVQSEARMVEQNRKKTGKSREVSLRVDPSFLACNHHAFMIAGLAFLKPEELNKELDILLVGLGGGGLPTYIQANLCNASLDVVDIDSTIVDIATKWFELKTNERLQVKVSDGIEFIKHCKKKYNAVMLDVNNNDPSSGLSVPPPAFLETEFLIMIKDIIKPLGILILNLVCRSEVLKQTIYHKLNHVFGQFWIKAIPEEVNEIIFLLTEQQMDIPKYFLSNIKTINDTIKTKIKGENLIESDILNLACIKNVLEN